MVGGTLLAAAASLFVLGVGAEPRTHGSDFQPHYVLVAEDGEAKIDCETRRSVLINGTTPGPPLHLKEDATTWIRVYNHLEGQNFTMHWHGLAMRTAPFSDGTPLISQWPIPPGHYFDYEVHPEAGDAGTYFYHSHVGFQQVTAHGALIVEEQDDAEQRKEYGQDRIMVLGDYYAKEDHVIEEGLLGTPFKWSGEPQAVLVEGQSGKAGFDNASDPSCQPHVIDVAPDSLYRLRVIGATALSMLKVGIEEHPELDVIEVDGAYTKPARVDHMQVAPGQRYSFRLKTKTAEELEAAGRKEFWIRYESRDRPESIKGYALLRYTEDADKEEDAEADKVARYASRRKPAKACKAKRQAQPLEGDVRNEADDAQNPRNTTENAQEPPEDAQEPREDDQGNDKRKDAPTLALPDTSPVVLPDTTYDYLEDKLEPKAPEACDDFPRTPTRRIIIEVRQNSTAGPTEFLKGSIKWQQNGHTWGEGDQAAKNRKPWLVSFYANDTAQAEANYNAALENEGYDESTQIYPFRIGEVVDIVWLNSVAPTNNIDIHPMHVHGEHPWVLGAGNGTYNPEEVEGHWASTDKCPIRRDTSTLYRYMDKGIPMTVSGWRAIRVRVTEQNVGMWLMHCHIAQHAVMEMVMAAQFGTAADIRRLKPPPPNLEDYLFYMGGAYGNKDRDAHVNHHYEETEETNTNNVDEDDEKETKNTQPDGNDGNDTNTNKLDDNNE